MVARRVGSRAGFSCESESFALALKKKNGQRGLPVLGKIVYRMVTIRALPAFEGTAALLWPGISLRVPLRFQMSDCERWPFH